MSATGSTIHGRLPETVDGSGARRLRRAAGTLACACLGAAALLMVWGCSSEPVADGATLLGRECGRCHSADRGRTAGKTREQWDGTVTNMVKRGAKLSRAEQTVLVDFLAQRPAS